MQRTEGTLLDHLVGAFHPLRMELPAAELRQVIKLFLVLVVRSARLLLNWTAAACAATLISEAAASHSSRRTLLPLYTYANKTTS